ncbi:MAG: terminase small subunit [Selenomonadaceae bacterium]|nr:terminase small subunit [Selenomonadaceae bacterium]MBR0289072.1 terminase small subunit [Selenomonadaceae bacterium]
MIKGIKGKERKREELNTRQALFVDYYIQTGNATESAKKAGYSERSAMAIGCELLRNAKIQAAIATRLKQLESERIAEDKEILEYITAVMRGETTEEVVMNIGTGKGYTKAEKVTSKVSAKERLKAAEMLAKVRGMFITRQEIDLQGSIPVVIRDDF